MALDRVPEFPNLFMELVEDARYRFGVLPITLGGSSGSAGGVGVPPGGFIGQLIQTRVTYDFTEAETLTVSSGSSLLDNLNRIRYRIRQLELGGPSSGSAPEGAIPFGPVGGGPMITDQPNLFFDNATNSLGVGTQVPSGHFESSGSGASTSLVGTNYGTIPGRLNLRRARGTNDAPTDVLSGDLLGQTFFSGYRAGQFATGPRVDGVTTQDWSSGSMGSALDFYAIPNNTNTAVRVAQIRERQLFVGDYDFSTAGPLMLSRDGASVNSYMVSLNDGFQHNVLAMYAARGTSGSPSNLWLNDEIGRMDFNGRRALIGGGYPNVASIRAVARDYWNGSATPTFVAIDVGGVEQVHITTGSFGLGTQNILGRFHSYQANADFAGVFEVAVNDHNPYDPIQIRRSRADSTAPNAGFGAGLVFNLEGATNGSVPAAGLLRTQWANNQTNDTTDRDSYITFHNLLDNTLTEVMRLLPGGGLTLDAITNGALRMKTITLSNLATAQFPLVSGSGTGTTGLAFIIDSTGAVAVFSLGGGATFTAEHIDNGAVYSITAGTGSSTNIYWSGANSRYEIENRRGSSTTYVVLFFVTS